MVAAGARLHVIDEVAGDYSQVFTMLRDSGSDAMDLTGPHSHIQITVNNADALTRRVQMYDERMAQLQQRQVELTNDKTNRRLSVLSVLSTIFLPLTLLAGIFGMNFEHMPGLSWRWTYLALLVLMVAISVGLLEILQTSRLDLTRLHIRRRALCPQMRHAVGNLKRWAGACRRRGRRAQILGS